MQTVYFEEFNFSILGIKWEVRLDEKIPDHVETEVRSTITYHLKFVGSHWLDDYRPGEDIIEHLCQKLRMKAEYIGDNSWILRETRLGEIRKAKNLIRARAQFVRSIHKITCEHNG